MQGAKTGGSGGRRIRRTVRNPGVNGAGFPGEFLTRTYYHTADAWAGQYPQLVREDFFDLSCGPAQDDLAGWKYFD